MSSMLSASPLSKEQLGAMLQSILHGTDNNERRAVEAQLIYSLSDATTLFSLVHLLMDQGNVPTGVRHLAAVLLRKRILTLWKALDDPTKVEIKALFLQQLGNEETKVVRFAIAHIVTRIAKVGWDAEEDGGKSAGWPELVQAIRVAADDPRPAMRELSMVLLFSVCEVFADENTLANLAAETVVRGVMDDEEVVCRAAIKAGITLLPCLYGKAAFRREFLSHLIPQCIAQLTRYCALREKVGLCVMFLDLLEECLEEVSAAKQAALLTTLIQAVLDLLLHRGVHLLIRENCGSFLGKVVQQKQKFTISHGFLPLLVRAGGQLMAEDASVGTLDGDVVKNSRIIGEGEGDEDTSVGDGEGGDDATDGEDADDDEEVDMLNAQNACMIGRQLLSALSSSLSSKTFTHEVMAMVEELKLLVSAAPSNVLSADSISIPSTSPSSSSSSSCYPYPKKSIIFTLASLSESNPGYLRRRVGEVVQLTEQYLVDPDPVTREAVSASLPWFCMHLQPEVLTHHQRLFPILIPLLEDKTDRVRRQAALALEVLCEHAADHLEPYVHPLVNTILLHLSTSSLSTQKNMCSVLSSIAAAKTQSFQPFAPPVLELLLQAVQMTAPNALPLRARAVETVGVVAVSMGKEAFSPYLPHFIGHVVDNFKQDDPLLREYSFGFLCNVCEMLEQDFLPYMEDTIQCAIHTIEQDRSIYKNKHLLTKDAPSLGQFPSRPFRLSEEQALQTKSHHYDPATGTAMPSASSPAGGGGGEEENNSDSNEEGSEEEIHMRVRTADIEEKSAAVYAIGVVAKVMGAAMGDERLTICWETLAALDEHFYPEIRANALIALGKLATASHGNGGVVEKTFSNDTLRAFTRRLVDTLLYQMLLPCIENDQEKDVVQAALETLTSLLQFFGPQCLLFGPDDVIRDCIQIMRVKMPCQKDDVEESEGEDSEEELDDGGEKGKNGDAKEKGEDGMSMFETDALEVGSDTNIASWTTTLDPSRILQLVNLPEDHDDEVMEGTMDCLEAVFDVYHQQAIPYARYVIPLLLLYADPTVRSSEDVVMAVGTFACLLESMGAAACENYFETAMQVAAGVMQHSEESSARSNAAYTLKVLLENCPDRFHPENGAYLQQTMELLWAIVSAGTETSSSGGMENGACGTEGKRKEEIPEAVDNAVSATCSLVRCLPPFILPLETILPVLFSHLPMGVDQTENKNAVHTLVYLYASPSTQMLLQEQATSPTWLPAFFHATLLMLQSRNVAANEKNMLAAEGLQVFMTNYPSVWMQAPEDLQNLIRQWQASSSVP